MRYVVDAPTPVEYMKALYASYQTAYNALPTERQYNWRQWTERQTTDKDLPYYECATEAEHKKFLGCIALAHRHTRQLLDNPAMGMIIQLVCGLDVDKLVEFLTITMENSIHFYYKNQHVLLPLVDGEEISDLFKYFDLVLGSSPFTKFPEVITT